jgi:hypothetical protein
MKKTLIVALMMMAGIAQAQVMCLVSEYTKQSGTHVDAYWRNQTACHNGTGGSAGIGPAMGAISILNSLTAYLENKKKETREDIERQAIVAHKIISCRPNKVSFGSRIEKFLVVKDKAINQKSGKVYILEQEGVYRNSGYTLDLNSIHQWIQIYHYITDFFLIFVCLFFYILFEFFLK